MNSKRDFVVGVLGVATYATINFFEQWAKIFPAEKEWDRPRIIIDNNCTLPSRVRALLYNENVERLVEGMTESIRTLIQAGASRILIACNTAHVFLPAIYEKFPQARDFVCDIVDNCVEQLKRRGVKKTFLLASEGTILAGLYQKKFADAGIDCGAPSPEEFSVMRNFIEAVKHDDFTPEVKAQFVDFSRRETASGGGIILGCTELPILRDKCADKLNGVDFFDPMILALENLRDEFNALPNKSLFPENHWQQLWNGRKINFDELDTRDERRLILELKRIVGWDFKNSQVDVDEFRREYEYLKTNLRVDSGSVFEVGCGTGANLYFFRKDGFNVGGSDYAQNLLDVAVKIIGAENFVECIAGEASQLPTDTKYDAVFAAAVFYYFPDTAYVEKVLNRMVAKAKKSVGLLRMLDAATEQDYLAYRRAHTKNYDELYKNLPKLFLSKKFIEDYAARNSLTVAFTKHHMPGFWNEQFNFDCFLYKV